MKEFKALVINKYDFTDKDNKKVKTTKLLVTLGEYGTFERCSELANDLEILEEVSVTLEYNPKLKKGLPFDIKEIIK